MSGNLISGIYDHDKKQAPKRGRGKKAETTGRKDSSGQEKVIAMDELKDKLDHLVDLHADVKEAREAFSEAVKAVAEKAGLLSSVVRQAVAAKAKDDAAEDKRRATQLALVFESLAI